MPGIRLLRPSGEIDLATADGVVAEWSDLIDRECPTTVGVDLRDVTFIDSAV